MLISDNAPPPAYASLAGFSATRPAARLLKTTLARNNELIFNISAGTLSYKGRIFLENVQSGGAGGHLDGLNNPAEQKRRNRGPIPVGVYRISAPINVWDPVLGHNRMLLTPVDGTNTFGRSALELHSRQGRVGTHGCIGTANQKDLDAIVALVRANHITRVRVIASETPTLAYVIPSFRLLTVPSVNSSDPPLIVVLTSPPGPSHPFMPGLSGAL